MEGPDGLVGSFLGVFQDAAGFFVCFSNNLVAPGFQLFLFIADLGFQLF